MTTKVEKLQAVENIFKKLIDEKFTGNVQFNLFNGDIAHLETRKREDLKTYQS